MRPFCFAMPKCGLAHAQYRRRCAGARRRVRLPGRRQAMPACSGATFARCRGEVNPRTRSGERDRVRAQSHRGGSECGGAGASARYPLLRQYPSGDRDFQLVAKASWCWAYERVDRQRAGPRSARPMNWRSPRSGNDGTTRAYTTICRPCGATSYTCGSWHGRAAGWFRRALRRRAGRIQAGGVERDVIFEEPDESVRGAIDEAYLDQIRPLRQHLCATDDRH